MVKALPPLNALRAFEVAARHLNFSRAAGELGVTPGAISKQILSLEDFIGARLFERLPEGMVQFPLLMQGFVKKISPKTNPIPPMNDLVRSFPAEIAKKVETPPNSMVLRLIHDLQCSDESR